MTHAAFRSSVLVHSSISLTLVHNPFMLNLLRISIFEYYPTTNTFASYNSNVNSKPNTFAGLKCPPAAKIILTAAIKI